MSTMNEQIKAGTFENKTHNTKTIFRPSEPLHFTHKREKYIVTIVHLQ